MRRWNVIGLLIVLVSLLRIADSFGEVSSNGSCVRVDAMVVEMRSGDVAKLKIHGWSAVGMEAGARALASDSIRIASVLADVQMKVLEQNLSSPEIRANILARLSIVTLDKKKASIKTGGDVIHYPDTNAHGFVLM